jgi:hypothetical protein
LFIEDNYKYMQIPLQVKLARWRARRLGKMLQHGRLSLGDLPILFANSFPKSGTHLLTQVLGGFTRLGPAVDSGLPAIVTFEGDSGRPRPVAEILHDLQRLLPGDIAYGHIHSFPETVSFLSQAGFATYFILRDPRDVVVSHAHYVTEMEPNHVHHRYYNEELKNFDQRLRTSILGLPEAQVPFPDIRARFEPYLGWLGREQVLVLRFEDFITQQEAVLVRVLEHALRAGFPLRTNRGQALQTLAESIDPQRSPTFRSGKIGGWKSQFTDDHKRLFKQIAGDLLVRLGYESNHDW